MALDTKNLAADRARRWTVCEILAPGRITGIAVASDGN
jgi:hypothetical protein